MDNKKMKRILSLVILVITVTTAIQGYWNYKNYIANKQQFSNEIQESLDTAVNMYFENLAKQNTIGFGLKGEKQKSFLDKNGSFDLILKQLKIDENGFDNLDALKPTEGVTILNKEKLDSISKENTAKHQFNFNDSKEKTKWVTFTDSLKKIKKEPLEFLTSKVVISITNDSLNLKKIDSFISLNLKSKEIKLNYGLSYKPHLGNNTYINKKAIDAKATELKTNSLLLGDLDDLKIHFKDNTLAVLKRIITGIVISALLILSLIFSLIYLLKVISKQKQLSEIKNDLISNITHEFKTPISTISVALESIKDSHQINDTEKTKRYLDISTSQLDKLTIMVEKLLETATLDSKNLELNKTEIDINILLNQLTQKHQLQTSSKTLHYESNQNTNPIVADQFHFENAINNIIDNAIKYGGNSINIRLKQDVNNTYITITDNGTELTKIQSQQIFDKFYRVPKGNTHNVKGFGIGLYYTKKIIEKHLGTINVELNNQTSFKITLPNEQ